MGIANTVFKNYFVLTVGNVIGLLVAVITSIYLARYLGPAGYGQYSFAFAFVSLFTIFLSLGIDKIVVREISRDYAHAPLYLHNSLFIKAAMSGVVFVVIGISINLMHYPREVIRLVYLFALSFIVLNFSESFNGIFYAFQKMEYKALVDIITKILWLIFVLAAIFFKKGLSEIVIMFLIVGVVDLGLRFLVNRKIFMVKDEVFNRSLCLKVIRESYPLMFSVFLGMIYGRMDTIMLSVMKGDVEVGIYNAPYKFLFALQFIPAGFSDVVFPIFSKLYSPTAADFFKTACVKSTKYLFAMVLPMVIGIHLLAGEIMLFMFGEQYVSSIAVLQVLSWVLLFTFLNNFMSSVIISARKQKSLILVSCLGAIINLVLNFVLIPKFSSKGSAIASLVTEGVVFVFDSIILFGLIRIIPIIKVYKEPLCAALVMGLFILCAKQMPFFMLIICSMLIYAFILVLMKSFWKEDIGFYKALFFRK